MSVADMMKGGILITVLGIGFLMLWMMLMGWPMYGIELGVVPDWAHTNATAIINKF